MGVVSLLCDVFVVMMCCCVLVCYVMFWCGCVVCVVVCVVWFGVCCCFLWLLYLDCSMCVVVLWCGICGCVCWLLCDVLFWFGVLVLLSVGLLSVVM